MTLWKAAVVTLAAVWSNSGLEAVAYEGSAKEQAACRPDVRLYCKSIPEGSDAVMYLICLQANRSKLGKACQAVLTSHGV